MGVGEEGDCPSNSKSLGGGDGGTGGGGCHVFNITHTDMVFDDYIVS